MFIFSLEEENEENNAYMVASVHDWSRECQLLKNPTLATVTTQDFAIACLKLAY